VGRVTVGLTGAAAALLLVSAACAAASYTESVSRIEVNSGEVFDVVVHLPAAVSDVPVSVVVFFHGTLSQTRRPNRYFRSTSFSEFMTSRGWAVIYPQSPESRVAIPTDASSLRRFCQERGDLPTIVDEAQTNARLIETVLARMPTLDRRVVLAGHSRGGALAALVAASFPSVNGVVNFAGGWVGGGCPNSDSINESLFSAAGRFPGISLWIYGDNDPVFSMQYIARMLLAHTAGGGRAMLVIKATGAPSDHSIFRYEQYWSEVLSIYLTEITGRR
jgi:poly(3-hydroxybutyrate) depolymerase